MRVGVGGATGRVSREQSSRVWSRPSAQSSRDTSPPPTGKKTYFLSKIALRWLSATPGKFLVFIVLGIHSAAAVIQGRNSRKEPKTPTEGGAMPGGEGLAGVEELSDRGSGFGRYVGGLR